MIGRPGFAFRMRIKAASSSWCSAQQMTALYPLAESWFRASFKEGIVSAASTLPEFN
jgi:hypothetical protein